VVDPMRMRNRAVLFGAPVILVAVWIVLRLLPEPVVAPASAPPRVAEASRDRGLPGTNAALETVVRDLLALGAAGKDAELEQGVRQVFLADPQAWFGKVFGADLGAKLAAEFTGTMDAHRAELIGWLRAQSQGVCSVRIRRGEKAGRHGIGFIELDVFLAMVEPVALLDVYIYDPKAPRGMHWGPFVCIDHQFRYLGRLDSAPRGDVDKLPPDPEGWDSKSSGEAPKDGSGS